MIRKLPSNLFYCLQLQVLNLEQCQCFKKKLSSIGQLKAFQEFDLKRCQSLQNLSTSIAQLNVLQKFDLSRCSNLTTHYLPSIVSKIKHLRHI